MKLTGKGHRHKTTQAKVKLGEVVEVAKAFQANTFANQLMKTARNTQQEQVKYTTKSPQSSNVFLVWQKTSTAPSSILPGACAGVEHDNKLDSNNLIFLGRHRRGNLRYRV